MINLSAFVDVESTQTKNAQCEGNIKLISFSNEICASLYGPLRKATGAHSPKNLTLKNKKKIIKIFLALFYRFSNSKSTFLVIE